MKKFCIIPALLMVALLLLTGCRSGSSDKGPHYGVPEDSDPIGGGEVPGSGGKLDVTEIYFFDEDRPYELAFQTGKGISNEQLGKAKKLIIKVEYLPYGSAAIRWYNHPEWFSEGGSANELFVVSGDINYRQGVTAAGSVRTPTGNKVGDIITIDLTQALKNYSDFQTAPYKRLAFQFYGDGNIEALGLTVVELGF